ncbi:unnamed protein product, partial [Ixodes pacificus]
QDRSEVHVLHDCGGSCAVRALFHSGHQLHSVRHTASPQRKRHAADLSAALYHTPGARGAEAPYNDAGCVLHRVDRGPLHPS